MGRRVHGRQSTGHLYEEMWRRNLTLPVILRPTDVVMKDRKNVRAELKEFEGDGIAIGKAWKTILERRRQQDRKKHSSGLGGVLRAARRNPNGQSKGQSSTQAQ